MSSRDGRDGADLGGLARSATPKANIKQVANQSAGGTK
jgi:hypothetical protein